MLKQIRENPAGPTYWGKNEKGMQASEENDATVTIPHNLQYAFTDFCASSGVNWDISYIFKHCPREVAWEFSAWLAASMSEAFSNAGYHKQVANRITEPYQYMNVIVSSTEWHNFFNLRCHPDAMPEFRDIAIDMQQLIHDSRPRKLQMGEWHIPFISTEEALQPLNVQLKLSTARCASTSFKTVEGLDMTFDTAVRIFDKLVGSNPLHASPSEHQAKFGSIEGVQLRNWASNFRSPWVQHRKFIENGWSF
jgi:hypothetical protein